MGPFHLFTLVTLLLNLVAPFDQKSLPTTNQDLTAQYGLALEAIFGMGIRLQAFLGENSGENFIISPISATAIIGQLMLGSDAKFRDQLYNILSIPTSYANDRIVLYGKDKNVSYALPYSTLHLQVRSLLKALEGDPKVARFFVLKQKSALFLDNAVTLRTRFERYLKDFYSVDLKTMDFAHQPEVAQRTINSWAKENTNGLITSIMAEPPSPSTASVFANAIYFRGEWETPFSDILNINEPFNVTETKRPEVTYMRGFLEDILYAESQDYRVISLPYKDEELGMYVILPKSESVHKYNIKEFVRNLKSSEVLETLTKAQKRNVIVKIPKMTLSTSLNILKHLQKYRAFRKHKAELTFTDRQEIIDKLEDKVDEFANFTTTDQEDIFLEKASRNGRLKIDNIVQQVVFAVNEKGTEAAAVTASTIDYIGGNKNFLINRPFAFFIRHEATSATLFWGTISNPAA